MTKILKVAKSFQRKLIYASAGNFDHLRLIHDAALAVVRLKPLWLTSANNDPYEETALEEKLTKIQSLANKAWGQVMQYGMPFNGPNGFAGFLNNMDGAAQTLSETAPKTHLDPQASNALQRLKDAVANSINQTAPIGIPAQNKPAEMALPEETIYSTPDFSESGAAYSAENEGADPEELSNVVHRLVNKEL